MDRAYFSATIREFLAAEPDAVLAEMVRRHAFALNENQRDAWL